MRTRCGRWVHTSRRVLLKLSLLALLPGCTAHPALGPAQAIERGIVRHEVSLRRPHGARKLWLYRPDPAPSKPVPCVFIAPAGTRLFHGSDLSASDMPEHLPYVRAGIQVVAYELDGPITEQATDAQLVAAAKAFQESEGGLDNARAAIDYALDKLPQVDPQRLYTAGHSSAATISLLVAEKEPRIAACIAFAPVCDLHTKLPAELIRTLDKVLPGYEVFVNTASPLSAVAALKCPTYVFRANDDSVTLMNDVAGFCQKARAQNPRVVFETVPSGGHYDSMVNVGIPHAIAWLRGLPVPQPAPATPE